MTTTIREYERPRHYELSANDLERLNAACSALGDWSFITPGERRYAFYRDRGYTPEASLEYAIAWCRNAIEQRERRRSHGTGD